MGWCLFFTAIFFVVLGRNDAQFFFQQPQQQQPFNFFNPQPFRPFQNIFQPPTTPQTTTVEFIPDPDKEQGNFPMPNPANWPVGPDWNDPRNNQDQQLGWGGNGVVGTTSTKPIVSTTAKITTTKATPTSTLKLAVTEVAPVAKQPPAKTQATKKRSSPKHPVPTAAPVKKARSFRKSAAATSSRRKSQ